MILQRLKLQLGTVLGLYFESLVVPFVRRDVLIKPRLQVFEERSMTERPFAIRPPLGVHLQQTQIHSQLNFLSSVPSLEFANDHLPRFCTARPGAEAKYRNPCREYGGDW